MPNASQDEMSKTLRERLEQLPKAVQNAITSANVQKHLRELANTHKLHLDQWESLENEVMLTLLGFQPIEDLGANIKKEVGVSDEISNMLAADISETVFAPIRDELERELSEAAPGPERPYETEEVAPMQAPAASAPTAPVAPATPPGDAPEGKAVRAPVSEAYRAGEPSVARKSVDDDPYRESTT